MGIDYAEEYLDWYGELWFECEEALTFLKFVWEGTEIQRDYKDWIYYRASLNEIKKVEQRKRIIELKRKIERKRLSKGFLTSLERVLSDKKQSI